MVRDVLVEQQRRILSETRKEILPLTDGSGHSPGGHRQLRPQKPPSEQRARAVRRLYRQSSLRRQGAGTQERGIRTGKDRPMSSTGRTDNAPHQSRRFRMSRNYRGDGQRSSRRSLPWVHARTTFQGDASRSLRSLGLPHPESQSSAPGRLGAGPCADPRPCRLWQPLWPGSGARRARAAVDAHSACPCAWPWTS